MSLRNSSSPLDSIRNGNSSNALLPAAYGDVRPHHLLALYAAYCGVSFLFTASGLSQKLAHKMLALSSRNSDSLIPLIYVGLMIPDCLIRWGIRGRLRHHLSDLRAESVEEELATKMKIVQQLTDMPIAVETDAANQQHYEMPSAFYDLCLGPAKKYSCGLWPDDKQSITFAESETLMLDLYCQRAGVVDGMRIVDLGCGWGSLTLHIAQRYPNCQITAISNSHSQREYIYKHAELRCLNVQNIRVITVRTTL